MKLQIGDIVQFHLISKNKWLNLYFKLQRLFDRGKSGHTAIYVGDNTILESYKTVQIRKVGDLLKNKNVAIQRLKNIDSVSQEEFKRAISVYTEENLGETYDYAQLGLAGLDVVLEFFLTELFKRPVDIPDLNIGDNSICGETVAEIYRAVGIELTNSRVPSPNDIMRSDRLETIKKFGEVI